MQNVHLLGFVRMQQAVHPIRRPGLPLRHQDRDQLPLSKYYVMLLNAVPEDVIVGLGSWKRYGRLPLTEVWLSLEFLFSDFVSVRIRATALMSVTHRTKCYAGHETSGHPSWSKSCS